MQARNSNFINGKCECIDGFKLKNINNQSVCTDKCFQGCSLCESGECSGCLDTNALVVSDLKCECKQGYFINYSETSLENTCKKCSNGCNSCESLFDCYSCSGEFILTDNSCICKPGYYKHIFNDENFKCEKCPFPCEECLDDKKCKSCKENSTLIGNKCVCMPGFKEYKSSCKQKYFKCSLEFENSTSLNYVFYKSSTEKCILIPKLPSIILRILK